MLSTVLLAVVLTALFHVPLVVVPAKADPQPIFHLDFDGEWGTTVKQRLMDTHGYMNVSGEGISESSFVDGISGYALSVPGSGSFLLSYNDILNPDQGSIEFWVRPKWNIEDHQYFLGERYMYFQEAMKVSANPFPLRDPIEISSIDLGLSFGKLYSPYTYTTNWNKGEWHQVIFTWDNSGEPTPTTNGTRVYVDGSYRQYTNASDPYYNSSFYNFNAPWTTGSYDLFYVGSNSTGGQLANCDIDELKIYDEPLDADTVYANYVAMFPVEFYAKESVLYANEGNQQISVDVTNNNASAITGNFKLEVEGGSSSSTPTTVQPDKTVTLNTVNFPNAQVGEYHLNCTYEDSVSKEVKMRTIRLFAISDESVPSSKSLVLNPVVSINCTDVPTTPDSANWTVTNQKGGWFGRGIASGDVNGDGYSDVIISAPDYDQRGAVFVYYGSPNGPSATPDWMCESDQIDSGFGLSVATGNITGGRYSDVIIGALNYSYTDGTDKYNGTVFVYYGSSTGLSTLPSSSGPSKQWNSVLTSDRSLGSAPGFGVSVASGDVNGDGKGDVIIGQCFYDGTSHGSDATEAVYVYYGPSLSKNKCWNVTSGYVEGCGTPPGPYERGFGFSVAAGDLNNDGRDDVIIGCPYYSDSLTGQGAVFVYYGRSSGQLGTRSNQDPILLDMPSVVPDWSYLSNETFALLGFCVACAGDVNNVTGYGGHKINDLIVGAIHYQILDSHNAEIESQGAAFVFYGSNLGLSYKPSQILAVNVASIQTSDWPNTNHAGHQVSGPTGSVPNADPEFGRYVAGVGDLNNDTYDDVVVGAQYYDYGKIDEGCSFVFYGSATGLSATPNWVIGTNKTNNYGFVVAGGDVNGDNCSDILAGEYTNNSAYVWYGNNVTEEGPGLPSYFASYFETNGTRIYWQAGEGVDNRTLYRETGTNYGDRFGYRFQLPSYNPGQPYMVAVTYPDDKKRTMEIDVMSQAPWFDIQTGVLTGGDYPCTGDFKNQTMIFWPKSADCMITIVNRLNDSIARAAAAKIEVYEIVGGLLPKTDVNLPEDGGRLLGLWWEDPSFAEVFDTTNLSYTGFYRTVCNAMSYLHYTGQNLLVYPVYFYTMPHYPSRVEDCLSTRRAVAFHPGGDWFELLLKVAEVNNVSVIPSLTINEIPSLMQQYYTKPADARGAPTENAILAIVDDIIQQYGNYTAFKGISFNLWDTALLWKCYNMGAPGSVGGNGDATGLFQAINAHIQNNSWGRPDLKLVVSCWLPESSSAWLDKWLGGGRVVSNWWATWSSSQLSARETMVQDIYKTIGGLDLAALSAKGIEIERVLTFDSARSTDGQGYEYGQASIWRQFFLDSSCYGLFEKKDDTAAAIYNGYFEGAGSFPAYTYRCGRGWGGLGTESEVAFWRAAAITPSGDYFMQNYVLTMTNLDPLQIGNGGLTVGTVGHEEQIQDFARNFIALPAKTFDIRWDSTEAQVRDLTDDGTRSKYYFYLVNKENYAVNVKLTFSSTSVTFTDLATDGQTSVHDPRGATTVIVLAPYELKSYSTQASISITNAEIPPAPAPSGGASCYTRTK